MKNLSCLTFERQCSSTSFHFPLLGFIKRLCRNPFCSLLFGLWKHGLASPITSQWLSLKRAYIDIRGFRASSFFLDIYVISSSLADLHQNTFPRNTRVKLNSNLGGRVGRNRDVSTRYSSEFCQKTTGKLCFRNLALGSDLWGRIISWDINWYPSP